MVRFLPCLRRPFTTATKAHLGGSYIRDDYTNITTRILEHVGLNLHLQKNHPLNLVHQRIINYFHETFTLSSKPVFSIFNELKPIVSVNQNFDSLLIPKDHVSRSKSDCYYLNREYLLRAHMTAHQAELLAGGFKNFLMIGDVYRRDEIDRTHYPVFHQVDAVRLKSRDELFPNACGHIFDKSVSTDYDGIQAKQECHSVEAVKLMEEELKNTLLGLVKSLFGDVKYRWVETTFPFTQPSWELEVFYNNDWLELLGCGIMKHHILTNAGVHDNIGWAFGIGLERVAMCLYKIPDIRLFWSKDSGFLSQFNLCDINQSVTYKEISQFPQCINDISFWLPDNVEFSSNDFYDLVRDNGGNIVEQVELIDNFVHPKTKKISHCYRITYRHMEKTLTQEEVNRVHQRIGDAAREKLLVEIR
ncbi:probable phenylalanine--tRNA ligase, mitochondrial [Anthonomus grandis grandis]|uniref:probable phenylalanine--tRNA ligase, mitochondrial n=1 Tax=Anthonomus grandis grandis TaxID=2921223 RepID=UPI002165B8E3|nr:probable phenylalanine--tRNA ligase, mitochondrial [Anthonomus grandis grandis]